MPDRDASSTPPPGVDNRRNYYRVLHVQPEAPVEVIKASYRTLMTQLKVHPDLGGSHAQAAMINEAWAVLGDAERRAAYDRLLRRRGPLPPRAAGPGAAGTRKPDAAGDGFQPMGPGQWPAGGPATAAAAAARAAGAAHGAADGPSQSSGAAEASGTSGPSGPSGASTEVPPSAPPVEPPAAESEADPPVELQRGHHCALCGLGAAPDPRPDARCLRCHAPLAALPLPGSPGHELLGRRGAIRRAQGHVAVLRIGWPSPELPVRWRDLSLTGLSVFTPRPIEPGQRIHLADQALEAVAEVVACRPQGRLYTVHARLVTALLLQSTGVFMSAEA